MALYSDRLLEHFRNPRHCGELPSPALAVEALNPACGDVLRLYSRIDGEVVIEARYKTRGCTASIAVGDALCEWLTGKTRGELEALTAGVLEEAVGGLSRESRHAAQLGVDAVRALLGAWNRTAK
jgi:NifU-like protein involved in Fe-S cluster formation